jgi:MFS family permease
VGSIGAALLSFLYLYAISVHNLWMAIVVSLLMWGVLYQGYNAVFPAFYPELFRSRYRVSAMAIGQNIGTMISAFLPAVFTAVAPPGSTDIPLKIGFMTLAIAMISCIAAYSARETYRLRLNDLGNPNATPVPKEEFERIRALSESETTGVSATPLPSG